MRIFYNPTRAREKAAWTHIPGESLNPRFGQFGRTTQGKSIAKAYTASVWAYRCCNILGNNSAGMPWGFFRKDEKIEGTYAQNLFEFVNSKSNWEDIMRNTVIDINNYGRGFWLPNFSNKMMVSFMRIPASQMTPNDNRQDGQEPDEWYWTRGAFQSLIPADAMAVFKLYGSEEDNPDSPMRIVAEKNYTEQKIDEMAVAHFDRGAIPPYIMASDQNVADRDLERYDSWWRRKFEGVMNKLRVGWVGGGLKPIRMTAPLKEMVLKELREVIRLEVCAAFGVPLAIAGGSETIFKATWVQQVNTMHHMKIIPDLKLMAGVINAQMMPLIEPGLEFRFLPEDSELLQEERTARSDRTLAEWDSGLISQEKALEILHYEPTDAGPGLVTKTAQLPAKEPPRLEAKNVEKAMVRRKAKRLFEERGDLEGFEFQSDILEHDEVFRIVEATINQEN